MSSPAVVPHCRPAGSWPQFFVTFGFGLGNPWPVTTLGACDCVCAVVPAQAATSSVADAANNGAIRGVDMCAPRSNEGASKADDGPCCKPDNVTRGQPGRAADCAPGGSVNGATGMRS